MYQWLQQSSANVHVPMEQTDLQEEADKYLSRYSTSKNKWSKTEAWGALKAQSYSFNSDL